MPSFRHRQVAQDRKTGKFSVSYVEKNYVHSRKAS